MAVRRAIFIIAFVLLLCSCAKIEGYEIKKENIDIFKGTEVWDLARAVKSQDTAKIKKLAKASPELLDFQDPKYDVTLLMWSVGMEKYKSAEALLKNGANPNIVANGLERYKAMEAEALLKDNERLLTDGPKLLLGETALYIAAGYSWIDRLAKKDPKYVNLLLQYGADPNICYIGTAPTTMPNGTGYHYGAEPGTSPLINSIASGIEKTKALVEGGADINHKTESGDTAAVVALLAASGNTTIEMKAYAYYLIVEKKANVTDPYYISKDVLLPDVDPEKAFYPVPILRGWLPDLNSEEHEMKMEIVDEFARQGADYFSTEIPPSKLEQIQKLYPDTWEEYIKVY